MERQMGLPEMAPTMGGGLAWMAATRTRPAAPTRVSDASTQESAPDVPGARVDASASDAILNGTCAMNGSPAPAGTVCRVAAGLCDVVEVCDGASIACPFDSFKIAGQVCRPKAGDCDLVETCTGTSAACPADTFLSKGAVCRSAVSVCDVADTCDGASAACPPDVVAPATIQCRVSTDGNICDPPEYCTGKSNQCPADAKYSPPAAAPGGVLVTPGTCWPTWPGAR